MAHPALAALEALRARQNQIAAELLDLVNRAR